MSKENLEHFIKQVADSKELQAKIGAEIIGDALVALGAAHGCEFSIEDVQAGAELSDAELEGVSGGFTNFRNGESTALFRHTSNGLRFKVNYNSPSGGNTE